MMTPEQQIQQQLASGTRATADVANYEAKMRLAKALQEKQVSRSPDGYMSPLSVAAKVFDDSRARQLNRETRPLLEAARTQATEAINAEKQFGLQNTLERLNLAKDSNRMQQESINQRGAQFDDTMEFNQGKGLAVKLTNDAGDLISAKQGQDGFYYDQQGNRLGSDWYKHDRPTSSSSFGLSSSKLQSGLNAFRKEAKSLQPMLDAASSINDMMADYAKGGTFEDSDDISGVGATEGGTGFLGEVIRFGDSAKGKFLGDEEDASAQDNFQRVRAFASKILKAEGGTAQTLQETRSILTSMGLNADGTGLISEEVFLRRWPEVTDSLKRAVGTVEGTFVPEIKDYYSKSFPVESQNLLNWNPTSYDMSNRVTDRVGSNVMTQKPVEAPQTQDASVNTPAQEAPPAALDVGYVEDGYRYIGGDPSAESSWEAVQ